MTDCAYHDLLLWLAETGALTFDYGADQRVEVFDRDKHKWLPVPAHFEWLAEQFIEAPQ